MCIQPRDWGVQHAWLCVVGSGCIDLLSLLCRYAFNVFARPVFGVDKATATSAPMLSMRGYRPTYYIGSTYTLAKVPAAKSMLFKNYIGLASNIQYVVTCDSTTLFRLALPTSTSFASPTQATFAAPNSTTFASPTQAHLVALCLPENCICNNTDPHDVVSLSYLIYVINIA